MEAAHEAINAFFMLYSLFGEEAKVWWVFVHRGFLEALCIGSVLREAGKEPNGSENITREPVFARAKADISEWLLLLITCVSRCSNSSV